MKRIFITRRLPPIAKDVLSEYFEVDENNKNEALPEENLLNAVSEYDGILSTVCDNFTPEVLGKASDSGKLKVISNYAMGLDNIDIGFAESKGIKTYNVPDVVTNSTAEHTFALLLSLIRKIPEARNFVRENKWKEWDPELFLGEELNGKTFGIIGYGKIGKAVARCAIGFGLNIIFFNRSRVDIEPELRDKTKQVSLEHLLKESDYISLHVPLTEQTKAMINLNIIKKMSKKPILLNLARGGVIDTDDLVSALKLKLIRGAVLDVTSPEPIDGKHPICNFDNCIVVPHIGTATKECRYAMAKSAAENIINHFGIQNER